MKPPSRNLHSVLNRWVGALLATALPIGAGVEMGVFAPLIQGNLNPFSVGLSSLSVLWGITCGILVYWRTAEKEKK